MKNGNNSSKWKSEKSIESKIDAENVFIKQITVVNFPTCIETSITVNQSPRVQFQKSYNCDRSNTSFENDDSAKICQRK